MFSTEELGSLKDGWVFETQSCYFDPLVGFATEWSAMDGPFAVADLEVTGVDALTDEIVEFAAIRVNSSGEIESELSLLAKVSQRLPDLILETGISQIDVDACGRSQDSAMNEFMAFLGNRPVFIHSAPFDVAFLRVAVQRLQRPFPNAVYDIEDIAFMTWPEFGLEGLGAIARNLGIGRPRKRALDDAHIGLTALLLAREYASKFEGGNT